MAESGALVGFGRQLRFVLRLDRVRGVVWFASMLGVVLASTFSVLSLYDTVADRQSYAVLATADVALKAITGPGYGLAAAEPTEGAVVMNEVEMYTYVAFALMSVFMLVRHTRAEEDGDRAELVRAAPIGRLTTLAVAGTWVSVLNVIIGVGLAIGLVVAGLPVEGSIAFGTAATGLGLVFVGITAITAQIASSARSARSTASATLGAFFILRAVGDIGSGRMSWLSPLGWAQSVRPFSGERWWVLGLLLATAVALFATAVRLSARRDLGAGILPQRPGRADAAPSLDGPLALAMRLQRGSVIGWAVGMLVSGYFLGLVADQAEELASNEAVAEMLAMAGQGSITDIYLGTTMLMMAIIATGFTVGSMLRPRGEERTERAQPVLATPVSRSRWLLDHAAVAAGGTVLIMAACGLGSGIGYFTSTGDAGRILPLLGSGLVMVVPALVLGAFTAALVGLWPGQSALAWAGVAVVAVIGYLAETLNLPQWVRDVSPFTHVPLVPAVPFDIVPMALLALVTAALLGVALIGLRRRDIGG
jgi:ABC-2 type transport system permease protein